MHQVTISGSLLSALSSKVEGRHLIPDLAVSGDSTGAAMHSHGMSWQPLGVPLLLFSVMLVLQAGVAGMMY